MLSLIYIFFVCLTLSSCAENLSSSYFTDPQQVHLSYGVQPSEMVVTWVTFQPTNNSLVRYALDDIHPKISQIAGGSYSKFVDGGSLRRVLYVHRVIVTGLIPDTIYSYQCGSYESWSKTFKFHTMPDGVDWSPRLAIFGDMGVSNAQSLPRLKNDVQNGLYDAILHVGDFAYDMNENDGMKGDEFMRMIEPLAANVPYMTSVGNHENAYNFSHYVNRFSMVNQDGNINNHFYSFNLGRAHIISFSTEFYFFVQYGLSQIVEQHNWLVKELQAANEPQNRQERPWLITMAHRPMYCSTKDNDDCTRQQSIIRNALEDLFYTYGVDLEIWAHEHVYERLFPVFNEKVYNGSYNEPYTNPRAPVHIITGSAGCREKVDPFEKKPGEWSAFRTSDYGYSRMTIINSTHIYLEQVSDDQGGKVIDRMMLIKDIHGPQAWQSHL